MLKLFKYTIFTLGLVVVFASGSHTAKAAVEAHPAGSLVVSAGTVYRVADDGVSLQSFDSAEKFLSNYYSFADALPSNSADRAKLISGYVSWGEGRLFNENGTVFLVSGNSKHGFSSAEIFLSLGFKFSQAVNGNLNLPVGSVINNASLPHLPGTFVLDQGTVWFVTETGRKGLAAPEVLQSWGRSFSDIVPANSADMQKSVEGLLSIRSGTLINDQGTIWVVEGNTKKSFPSAACFTNFGYSFARVLRGSAASYTNAGSICGPEASSSYSRTTVQSSRGNFTADVMKINLAAGDIKVVTATANTDDCVDNCPVKPLKDYVDAAGGFAAMNGTYFCPKDYAECANKTGSFYWKVYNSVLGKMINANNGIKEEVPFIAFSNSTISYYNQYKNYKNSPVTITAGINHEPALVENGVNILNEGALDSKERTVKSTRGALGFKGQMVYAVIVRSATIPDLASVMQSLGVDYAVNLDGGGSSSMIYDNAYKVGPGRNIPNAIIFVKQ